MKGSTHVTALHKWKKRRTKTHISSISSWESLASTTPVHLLFFFPDTENTNSHDAASPRPHRRVFPS